MAETKNEMSLDSFIRLVHVDAEKFKEHWLKNQKKNPANWPKNLGEGDWWEQFVTFLGVKKR